MRKLRAHPVALTLFALLLAAVAVVAIANVYGFARFGHAWSNLKWGWLALTIVASGLSVGAYAVAYRALASVRGGPDLRLSLVLRLVAAGFGPSVAGGGFALDKRAFEAIGDDDRAPAVRVLALGALEWALLAPAAWLAAVVLLASADPRPMPSLLWPWAIAVPIAFAVGLWLAVPRRRERLTAGSGRWRRGLDHSLRGVRILHALARSLPSCWVAWVGIALYWALDVTTFYGALRFVGIQLNLGELILAYATGYALTRRSMPLGGAGVTEVLMTFALHWVGQPVAPALAAVVVYRLFNFAVPAIPALLVGPRVRPLLDAADLGETPARAQRRRAAAPLGNTVR